MDNNWIKYSGHIAREAFRAMQRKNLTQSTLAGRMGRTQQYVSHILSGRENLTLETIALLENALGTDLTGFSGSLEESRVRYGNLSAGSTLPLISSTGPIIKFFETGDRPLLVKGDDGKDYLCKTGGFGPASYNLARELIGTSLADIWGICDGRLALVDIHPGQMTVPGYNLSAPALGREWTDRATEIKDPSTEFIDIGEETMTRILEIAIFDLWLCNEDRLNNNLNLLYSMETETVIAIDHAGIFNTSFETPLQPLSLTDSVLYSNLFNHVSSGRKPGKDIMENVLGFFQEKVEKSRKETETIWGRIPGNWSIDRNRYDVLTDFIYSGQWINDTEKNFTAILEMI